MGHNLTADWTLGAAAADHTGLPGAANFDLVGVHSADFVVVLLPGGEGTHVELGSAIAWGKTVFVIADGVSAGDAFAETMETCPFYFASLVTRCDDIESFQYEMARFHARMKVYSAG